VLTQFYLRRWDVPGFCSAGHIFGFGKYLHEAIKHNPAITLKCHLSNVNNRCILIDAYSFKVWWWICSAQYGNLRNLEIALRILRIPKLRANLEIAHWVYAISRLRGTIAQSRDRTAPVRNLKIAQFL